jgi:sugar phosphate isomerase/epimerase
MTINRRTFLTTSAALTALAGSPRMRLGIGAYTYHNLTVDAMIEQMRELRITEMEMSRGEFMTFKRPPLEMFETFRRKIDAAGIRCVSYYAPTIKTAQDLDDSVRFATTLGASNITGDPEGPEMLRAVDERLTREGMTFGIHNHFFAKRKFVYESPEDILNALKGRSKTMGCTLDIGHIISCGFEPLDAVRKLGPYLKLVHLKDIEAPGAEVNVALGTGKCRIPEVMAALRKMKFAGLIAFEYEKEGDINADVARQIAYARKLL